MKRKLILLLTGVIIAMLCSLTHAESDHEKKLTFKSTPLVEAARKIGEQFKVTVIVDQSLKVSVSQSIDVGGTIEDSLKQLLEPFGYFYTKVDNYYVIGGPSSPLTIFADTESALIPVGFLDKKQQSRLEEFKNYIVYDLHTGAVFVKAPSSLINRILGKLWGEGARSGQLAIVYSFRVVDLAYVPNFDVFFQGTYTNNHSDDEEIIVNSDQIARFNGWDLVINKELSVLSLKTIRQPWVSVLPGKTMRYNTTYHWATPRDDLQDRKIILEITPTHVDEENALVTSEIRIGQDEPSRGTALKSNLVSTTVKTVSSSPKVIALVRSVNHKVEKGFLRRKQTEERRDFAVLMTVYPLRMQKSQDSESTIVAAGNFDGLDPFFGESPKKETPRSSSLLLGLSGGADDIDPWLNLDFHMAEDRAAFQLEYLDSDNFSIGFSYRMFAFDPVSVELLTGEGVGPDHTKAVLLGIGDETSIGKQLSLFAKYYPLVYLSEENKIEKHAVWHVGTRIGGEQLGLSCTAIGDEDLEGWDVRFNYDWNRYSLSIGGNTTDDETNYFLGWGFKL